MFKLYHIQDFIFVLRSILKKKTINCFHASCKFPEHFLQYLFQLLCFFFIIGGDDSGTGAGAAKFGFDAASGALSKTGVVLDATTKASYLLTFTCVEGAHTATTTVTICVNSDSNCPSSSKASINSGVLAGLIVPALLAIYRLS